MLQKGIKLLLQKKKRYQYYLEHKKRHYLTIEEIIM